MDIALDKIKTDYISKQLSISLIKEIIKKYFSENNNVGNKIDDYLKIVEKIDYFLQNNLTFKYFLLKINKFLIFSKNVKNLRKKEYINNKEIILKNNIIFTTSIFFLRININNCNHYKIREYLKLLLKIYIDRKIAINKLFSIIEIILISIIEILKKNTIKQYQILDINNEPLLFIKDIIMAVFNFSNILMKDNIFIESLINLFNKLLEHLDKSNIIFKENELWLILFENNSIEDSSELYLDKSYQTSMKKLIDFIKDIYKINISNNFYYEIYQKSSIDFIFYSNALTLINELIHKEITKQKNVRINKGIYLLGKYYIKEHLSFTSNEFSILLSFKLLSNANLSILNLVQNGKGIINISIKNDCLNIEISNNMKWNTNIKIKTNIFYFITITYNKKNKKIKLYINYDEIYNKKIEEKQKEKDNINIPKFDKDMDCIIGDLNLFIIMGDILFINKEFDIDIVEQLFEAKVNYSNLIVGNNVNCDLINNIIYSKNFENIINNFKSLKYEYIFIFTPKLLLSKEKNLNDSFVELNRKDYFSDFFNTKGIEFLTFMLHNIDSRISDSKLLDIYLSKTIQFLSNILELLNNPNNEYIIEFSKEDMNNKFNIFFMTLFHILNSENKNKYYRILSSDFWYNLFIIFSLDLDNSIIYKRIILSILLDYNLFEQRNYITQINNILNKIKINELNDELLFKIFCIDFILESKNIKHKNYLNLINSICNLQNPNFSKILIEYVIKIESEIKNYHYLKIIYINIKNLKNILSSEINYLYEFVEKQLETIDHFHCKYCLYMIISL